METCFNYCDTKKAFFSSDEQRWINKMKKLLEAHPTEMKLIASPETNDGCIYVELPVSWLKVQPPRKIEMTEEEREIARERFRKNVLNKE